jgi:PAS domain S-box-containing protein
MHDRETLISDLSKPRILLVEDDATLREHLASRLSDEYVVDTAANGREALAAVIRSPPLLIVTDIVMPDIDGIELLKALRSTRRTQTIPVLLISGRALDEQRIEGFKEGADAYLPKPYTERELRACIGSILQSTRLRMEAARDEAIEQADKRALAERAELLESITDAFYALDRQFRFTYLNRRALDHFGKSSEQLLGQALWDVFPQAQGTVFQREYERVMQDRTAVQFEGISLFTGGWIDVRAYPTPQGLAAYFRDISDRKQAEERLREADRRKTEFLAVLAHELRNPLAPLRNSVQILKLHAAADSFLSHTVRMMDRQMTHLVRLVDDLLDVSRITSGRLELRRQPTLLTEALMSAAESARPVMDTHQQELVVEIREPQIVIDGDPDRLMQLFSNLLLNSAKYTDLGGRIRLTVCREDGQAVIDVEDDGIGIPADRLEQVFDMFSQVRLHESRNSDEGLGIGLSLVRTLVQLHGGSVRAFSDGPGLGARFSVRLPIMEGARALPDSPVKPSPECELQQRVLVVDDNADAASALALLLELSKCEVQTAADGEEAIQRAIDFEPDIIFMDLAMPRLNGLEATRRLRTLPQGKRARIVALSGYGQEEDRQRTREAGMDAHLVKPVAVDALKRVLAAGRLE